MIALIRRSVSVCTSSPDRILVCCCKKSFKQFGSIPRLLASTSIKTGQRHSVDATAGQYEVAVRCGHHVANHASARRDHPGLEAFGLGVKAHERVRSHRRFAVPHDVADSGNAVGLRVGSAWRRSRISRNLGSPASSLSSDRCSGVTPWAYFSLALAMG